MRYIIKSPTHGMITTEDLSIEPKFAVLVRKSLSDKWRYHSAYQTEQEANEIIPAYNEFNYQTEEYSVVTEYKGKCVRPVIAKIVPLDGHDTNNL